METYKQTKTMSGCLFIESKKLVQEAEKFTKQLKICAKVWGDIMNIHSEAKSDSLLISFYTQVILVFCVNIFLTFHYVKIVRLKIIKQQVNLTDSTE